MRSCFIKIICKYHWDGNERLCLHSEDRIRTVGSSFFVSLALWCFWFSVSIYSNSRKVFSYKQALTTSLHSACMRAVSYQQLRVSLPSQLKSPTFWELVETTKCVLQKAEWGAKLKWSEFGASSIHAAFPGLSYCAQSLFCPIRGHILVELDLCFLSWKGENPDKLLPVFHTVWCLTANSSPSISGPFTLHTDLIGGKLTFKDLARGWSTTPTTPSSPCITAAGCTAFLLPRTNYSTTAQSHVQTSTGRAAIFNWKHILS